MLTAHDAFLVARNLATLRTDHALASIEHRFAYRLDRLIVEGALLSLTLRVPDATDGTDRVREAKVAAQLVERVMDKLPARMEPGGGASRAFALGVAVGDVIVLARSADLLGLILAIDGPNAALEQRLSQTLPRLADARASLDVAIARFRRGLADAELSPVVGEATSTLEAWAQDEPPRFDAKEAAEASRPGQRWCARIEEGMRRVLVALSLPPETQAERGESPAELALRDEIIGRPYDDAPRLTWAALADRRSDLRGELVRLQIATRKAQRSYTASQAFEDERVKSLVGMHPEWLDEVRRLGATSAAFRGGFVEEITIAASAFLENGARLRRTEPIRRVRLTAVTHHLDALLDSGLLDGIFWLDLSNEKLDDTHIGRLASAEKLFALRALGLGGNLITDAGVRALWAAPALASLLYCELDGNPCAALTHLELTPVEMSVYEYVQDEPARELEKTLGSRRWVIPWCNGWPPALEAVLAKDLEVQGWCAPRDG